MGCSCGWEGLGSGDGAGTGQPRGHRRSRTELRVPGKGCPGGLHPNSAGAAGRCPCTLSVPLARPMGAPRVQDETMSFSLPTAPSTRQQKTRAKKHNGQLLKKNQEGKKEIKQNNPLVQPDAGPWKLAALLPAFFTRGLAPTKGSREGLNMQKAVIDCTKSMPGGSGGFCWAMIRRRATRSCADNRLVVEQAPGERAVGGTHALGSGFVHCPLPQPGHPLHLGHPVLGAGMGVPRDRGCPWDGSQGPWKG